MKTPAAPALASLALIVSGCNAPRFTLPPDADFRSQLGRVTVVALTDSTGVRVQVPDSKADIAAEKLSFEAVTPRQVGRKIIGHGTVRNGPEAAIVGGVVVATPLVVMGGAPLWQEMRRVYGLAIADTADAVAHARTTLDANTTPVRFEQQLRGRVLTELHRQAPAVATAPTRPDADTVLELMVYEPNISSRTGEGINPGMNLSLGLRVRLLDARDGRELYYDYLDYRGAKHTFVNWGAHDAKLLREELDHCLACLSAEIVAQLFARESNAPIDHHALAAVGLERRPASPVFPATPGLVLPPARAVARN